MLPPPVVVASAQGKVLSVCPCCASRSRVRIGWLYRKDIPSWTSQGEVLHNQEVGPLAGGAIDDLRIRAEHTPSTVVVDNDLVQSRLEEIDIQVGINHHGPHRDLDEFPATKGYPEVVYVSRKVNTSRDACPNFQHAFVRVSE